MFQRVLNIFLFIFLGLGLSVGLSSLMKVQAASKTTSSVPQDPHNDFVIIRDGKPVTIGSPTFYSPQPGPASPQGSLSSRSQVPSLQPRNFVLYNEGNLCHAYTLGMGSGWREPMELYLGQGAREYLPFIKKAADAWNALLAYDVIEVKEDEVDYAYGPSPASRGARGFYQDNISVIYFPESGYRGYALGYTSWNAEKGRNEMIEADIFIKKPSFIITGISVYSIILHEMGHALGLGHIGISGNMMSYNGFVSLRQILDPFLALGGFSEEYGDSLRGADWEYLYSDSRYTPLVFELLRPQAQDKLMFSCLYDFATWGRK